MKSRINRKVIIYSLVCSILMTNSMLFGAEHLDAASTSTGNTKAGSTTMATTIKVNTIPISKKSYASLQSANVMMNDKGNILTYTIAVFNNDANVLNFLDYWVQVRTKSGKAYKTQLITADKEKKYIQPGTSQVLTFYSEVDANFKLTDLMIDFIKWDFSVTDFTRTIGTFKIPANYSSAAATGTYTTVTTSTTKFKTRVEKSTIIKDANYYYMDIIYNVENIGFKSSDLSSLVFNVITPSKSIFSVNSEDLKDISLQPRENKTFTLRAALPKTVDMYSLQLVASINEETDKISIPRGIYKLQQPQGVGTAKIGTSRSISIQAQETSLKVNSSYFVQSESGKFINTQIEFINKGKETVSLPEYSYQIRTKNGVLYSASAPKVDTAADKLIPNTNKTVSISAEVPEDVDMTDAELLIYSPKTETSKMNYLLASFKLPFMNSSEGKVGEYQKIGNYNVRVDNIQRMPWNNEDVISATLTIQNKTNNPQKIPTYQGSFVVNGVKLAIDQTKTVRMDDIINIAPHGDTQITVYSKIPYTTEISDVKFLLEEKIDDKNSNVLMAFGSKQVANFDIISQDQPYEYKNIGYRSNIKVENANVYKNDDGTNLFYGEVVLQNMEERNTLPNKLRGLIKLDTGQLIPLQASDYKKSLLPDGKLLLSFWGTLPKSYESNNLEFIIGQGVTGNKLSSGEDVSDALVNGVAFDINLEKSNSTQNGSLENIKFSNNLIGMRKFYAYLNSTGYDVQGINLNFEYDLIRSNDYDAIAEDHKIVLELVDKQSNIKFSKEFALSSGKDGEELLSEGKDVRKSITFDDKDIINKITKFDKYTVNIYDKVGDTKILLGSKEFNWFIMQW